ncbi:MAG: hypothetical protein COZ32_09990 [Nitrospirae bacterium CG_4_10_14_3_um_filter_53_41]|nr:MAG: hypothetical protein COW52_09015 [Nitrospirae bacterium CG17_big_fil_post_rev_8_21_14_2_50_50_9]PIX85152.1 MAG: hypothetical protein COZ32_09990 [Nitrospirae bacterium CG_4_10_14_3_um_filter_53_41]
MGADARQLIWGRGISLLARALAYFLSLILFQYLDFTLFLLKRLEYRMVILVYWSSVLGTQIKQADRVTS